MLQRVAVEIPEIYAFCYLAYDQPSILQFGEFSISSEVSAQQRKALKEKLRLFSEKKDAYWLDRVMTDGGTSKLWRTVSGMMGRDKFKSNSNQIY